MESVLKVEDIKLSKFTWAGYIASQGSYRAIEEYTERLKPEKKLGSEELLRDFKKKGNAKK